VVRPANEGQLVALSQFAQRENIALVPRAWATSGYGGVLPPEGAIVVDLSGWQKVLSVDVAHMKVRAQAGAVWEEIDREIRKQGLTLRLYPSSYPSSSVGGWLAQGGSGFGSYEYGTFKDNVVAARVVLPNGETREFSGEELLTLVADAEGTTGFITEVEFRVRPLEPEVHRLVAFESAAALGAALSSVSDRRLPIWSITFLNPESTRLKKRLPHRHGHPYEEAHEHYEPKIPESYLADRLP
jgi:FAD/FMN-containing dehydrogenase